MFLFSTPGGDSKTLMVVQLSPVEKNVGETVCSLTFAQRVRAVELGQATKKTEAPEVVQLKERLRELEVSKQCDRCYMDSPFTVKSRL